MKGRLLLIDVDLDEFPWIDWGLFSRWVAVWSA